LAFGSVYAKDLNKLYDPQSGLDDFASLFSTSILGVFGIL